MALVEHHADKAANVGDSGSGTRFTPAFDDVERFHVGIEPSGFGCSEIEVVHAQLASFAQKIVIDIGDVANTARFMAKVAQAALQNVVGDVGRSVPKVRCVVGRNAAGVHEHNRAGLKRNDLATSSVVDVHRAGRSCHGYRSFSGSIPVNFTATRVLYLRFSSSSTAVNASIGAACVRSPASSARISGISLMRSMETRLATG